MIRLTVAKRLWLGLALMLALLAAAYFISLQAARTLQSPFSELAASAESRRAAVAQMQASVDEMSQAVNSYRKDRDPKHLAAIAGAQKRFDAASMDYQRLASSESDKALSRDTAERYGRYTAQAAELVRALDAQAARGDGYV